MKKIALFGGSFDPIHNGHVSLLEEVQKQLALDEIILIPCKQSPHKANAPLASDQQRLKMCRLAVEKLPYVTVSDIEIERTTSPSFSWMTVEHYQSRYPESALYWIMGTDQWEVLDKWDRADFLASVLHFIVIERQTKISPRPGTTYSSVTFDLQCSSTSIRKALANGDSPPHLPTSVLSYIEANDLYHLTDA
jgi:nicotinate-nucleotide adenylyltransferase